MATMIEIDGINFHLKSSKAEARRSIHEAHNPCLIEIRHEGRTYYDAAPAGYPIPRDQSLRIIERCTLTARGMRWRAVEAAC